MTTFLTDYSTAIETYLDDHVNVEIRNVTREGDQINVGETGTFEILITNHGPVRMRNIRLLVRGLDGMLVKHQGALSQFDAAMTLEGPGDNQIDVAANGGTFLVAQGSDDWSQILSYKAPSQPRSRRGLIEVSIDDWTADLTPIHRHSSGAGAATTFVARVFGD